MLYDWMRRRYRDTGDSSISVISDSDDARESSEMLETHHMTILKTVRRISQTTTSSWRMTFQKEKKLLRQGSVQRSCILMWRCDEDFHGNHTQIVWNLWRCGWNYWLLQEKLAENQANICVRLLSFTRLTKMLSLVKGSMSTQRNSYAGVEIRKFHLVSTKNTSLDITFVS